MRILIFSILFLCYSISLFAQNKSEKEKKVHFYLDIGLTLSDVSFYADNPQFALLGGVNLFLKNPQIGIRYRKTFHYTYDRYRAIINQPADQRLQETNIGYYETSTLEAYKSFDVGNSLLSAGLGGGYVYPYYPDKPLWTSTVFISYQLSFTEIELRSNIPLTSKFLDWRIPQEKLIDIGTVFFSIYYRFPRYYYRP